MSKKVQPAQADVQQHGSVPIDLDQEIARPISGIQTAYLLEGSTFAQSRGWIMANAIFSFQPMGLSWPSMR